MVYSHLQVALPALHIDLGIFLKIFQLLENTCHRLDKNMAVHIDQSMEATRGGTTYHNFVKNLGRAQQLEKEAQQHEIFAAVIQEQLIWLLLSQNLSQVVAADLKSQINQAVLKASTLVIHSLLDMLFLK